MKKYKVYAVTPFGPYSGMALVAAENAAAANNTIDRWKEIDSDNGCNSRGLGHVDESDVIEGVYSEDSGFVYNEIYYTGLC